MTAPEPRDQPSRRLSVTKLQRQSAAGADLVALCQTVTEDGSLDEKEVAALRQWLGDHGATDLPARDYLLQTVERIVADGKVTPEERRELYRAIESVLPPDVRNPVRAKRRELEEAAAEQVRAAREEGKQTLREEKEQSKPVGSWNFMVAGVRYEGRPEVIDRHAAPDDAAYLVRDRHNKFSRHAIEVRLSNGMQIGFVPEDYAIEVAPLLDGGLPHEAFITKILTGGRSPIPVVQAYVYRADVALTGLVLEKDVPAKVLFRGTAKPGCAIAVLVVTSAAVASLVLPLP